ncbi:hypothetical protein IB279_34125 [Ensifer sp. ENS06]|uniref:hypothetical protein n=1 Tax=Ensifer sp. ENS06 TaxID=2769276 RepID=UPI0017803285|nr:hypothetical protein [Ensifer sp. ENS06]MBD9627993.1 hypothetical protein [Ensifer sp. ENS06]
MSQMELAQEKLCHALRWACVDVYAALADVCHLYPNFEEWYWDKVVPELGVSRSIFVDWMNERITGVVIAKRTCDEQKVCTVWVDKGFRAQGVASSLIGEASRWLGTDYPMITIPQNRLSEFSGILRSGRFAQTQKLASYYRAGETEHVFNGWLSPYESARLLNA